MFCMFDISFDGKASSKYTKIGPKVVKETQPNEHRHWPGLKNIETCFYQLIAYKMYLLQL
jgi:hypothetical protein